MKLSTKLLSAAVLMASSSIALAATTTIDLQVTRDAYVNITGTLATTTVALPSGTTGTPGIPAGSTGVGDLGTETNTTGGCDLNITSANGFNLLHDASTALLYGTNYTVGYNGTTFGPANTFLSLASCTNADLPVTVDTPAVAGEVPNGTYNDTLTIAVTVQ